MMAATLNRCEICGLLAMRYPHHICSRGAHGEAAECDENKIHLCQQHHVEAETLGRDEWAGRYGLEGRVLKAQKAVRDREAEMNDRARGH